MGNITSTATTPWDLYPSLTKTQAVEFQQAGIEYFHAQLLYNRGIKTPEAMKRFIEVRYDQLLDPYLLIDMERALERVQRTLITHEHVTVFGDFDADGVTSAALITRALRALKHPDTLLDSYILDRIHEARGLSQEALDQMRARGTSLVITTDCGSSDVEAVEYAKTLGIDIIITDHHQPPQQLPRSYALINPWRPDCTYPQRYLCGVGVAFKLAQALFAIYHREALDLLELVAIGTIADLAPLLGENHTLVRLGLQQLNRTKNAGLLALMQVANLYPGEVRERDIAFGLAPRLNAASRMKHAAIAFQLLVTDNNDEAQGLAGELEELNRLRQQQTEELMVLVREQAQSQLNNRVVLVFGEKDTWPEGIIGLAAGKFAEEIKRPVFVLSRDATKSRGSGRSYGEFNLIEALRTRADLFSHYGGHEQAAGFTITNTNIEALYQHLLAWHARSTSCSVTAVPGVDTRTRPDPDIERESSPWPDTQWIDLVVARPQALGYEAYTKINQLSPFGKGNPEPIFRMNDVRLSRCWASRSNDSKLQVRLQVGSTQFKGTYRVEGTNMVSFKEGSLVNVIFCIQPVLKAIEGQDGQDIWLQVLHMELVPG